MVDDDTKTIERLEDAVHRLEATVSRLGSSMLALRISIEGLGIALTVGAGCLLGQAINAWWAQ